MVVGVAISLMVSVDVKQHWTWRGTLYLRAAVYRRWQRPPKGLGTDKTERNIAPNMYVIMRRVRPGSKNNNNNNQKTHNSVLIQTISVLFVLMLAMWAVMKETPDLIWVLSYRLTAIWAPTNICPLSLFLTGRKFVRRTYFGQFDELWFVC